MSFVLLWYSSVQEITFLIGNVYRSFLLRDVLLPAALSVGGFFLLNKGLVRGQRHEWFFGLISFLSGSLALYALIDLFSENRFTDAYSLFLLPVLRASIIFGLSPAIVAFRTEPNRARWLFLVVVLALPFLLAFVPMSFYIGRQGISVAIGLALFALVGSGFVWVTGSYVTAIRLR
jgi:hypothetical protein